MSHTFEKEGHEGDDWWFQFGNSESVGPVVSGWILFQKIPKELIDSKEERCLHFLINTRDIPLQLVIRFILFYFIHQVLVCLTVSTDPLNITKGQLKSNFRDFEINLTIMLSNSA